MPDVKRPYRIPYASEGLKEVGELRTPSEVPNSNDRGKLRTFYEKLRAARET